MAAAAWRLCSRAAGNGEPEPQFELLLLALLAVASPRAVPRAARPSPLWLATVEASGAVVGGTVPAAWPLLELYGMSPAVVAAAESWLFSPLRLANWGKKAAGAKTMQSSHKTTIKI